MPGDLGHSVNSLVRPAPSDVRLPAKSAAQPIPAKAGVGPRSAPSTVAPTVYNSTFTLAGPLTVTSSDGLFTWAYPATLQIALNGVTYTVPVIAP